MSRYSTHGSAPRAALWLIGWAACCGAAIGCGDDADPSEDGGGDAAITDDASSGQDRDGGNTEDAAPTAMDASGGGGPPPGDCPELGPNALPELLSCTGLYADIGDKTLAAGVREFAPAHVLWSDGAEKHRFVLLPEGEKIDASDPEEWKLPNGTKLWKEFQWKGQRVETRLFHKNDAGVWLKTSYHWQDAEAEAERFAGGDVDVAGDTYYIPSGKECDQCHKGRTDRALGFEAALLGLPGATGVTLADLINEGLLEGNTLPADLELGEDATEKAGPALAWMHVNCGVSCHNGNSASEAYKTDLRLRLDPRDLDGRATVGFDAYSTAVGIEARTPSWAGELIIAPGSPADSLLVSLIRTRNAEMRDQMPPIASRVVDEEGVAVVEAWIEALGAVPDGDAGTP